VHRGQRWWVKRMIFCKDIHVMKISFPVQDIRYVIHMIWDVVCRDSDSGDAEDSSLLGYCTLLPGKQLPKVQSFVLLVVDCLVLKVEPLRSLETSLSIHWSRQLNVPQWWNSCEHIYASFNDRGTNMANREGCHNKYFANKQTRSGWSREPGAFAILISVRAVQRGPFVSWDTYCIRPLSCKI